MAGKKQSGPFVVAYGEEDLLLDRLIRHIQSVEGRDCTLLDGDDVSAEDFFSACDQISFDDTPRVVILDNAEKMKSSKSLKAFVEGRSDTSDCVVYVIVRSGKLSDVWQKAGAKGAVKSFPKFKPWEGAKIQARIVDEAERLKLKLDADVPELFVKLLGDNLRSTSNELQKLTHIVQGRAVTKKDVIAVIAPDVPAEPYEVAEAATNRDSKAALRLMGTLSKNMGDGACVPVCASLMRQVERLVLVRHMLDRGESSDSIAAAVGLHKFVIQKNFIPRAQKYTLKELVNHMKNLCRLDSLVKSSARSKRTHVELAVLALA